MDAQTPRGGARLDHVSSALSAPATSRSLGAQESSLTVAVKRLATTPDNVLSPNTSLRTSLAG